MKKVYSVFRRSMYLLWHFSYRVWANIHLCKFMSSETRLAKKIHKIFGHFLKLLWNNVGLFFIPSGNTDCVLGLNLLLHVIIQSKWPHLFRRHKTALIIIIKGTFDKTDSDKVQKKELQMTIGQTQCGQMVILFFHFWPFTATEICQRA